MAVPLQIQEYINQLVDELYNKDIPTWTTANGNKISIVDMSQRHLANTILYLEKTNKALSSSDSKLLDALKREHKYRIMNRIKK